jgi:hypothetical protein
VNDPWYGSTTLGENKYIDIDTWKNDYFTGCSWCGATGTTYISVVDPDPLQVVRIKYPQVMERKPQVISERLARRYAEKYLISIKTEEIFRKYFPKEIYQVDRATVGLPLLVKRTDREKGAYYIIPLQTQKMTSGALIMDAYSGQYKEVTFVKEPINYVPKLQQKRAIDMFMKNLPLFMVKKVGVNEKFVKPTPVKPEDVKIVKMERVWEPSLQSQNPFYPMWQAIGTIKDKEEQVTLGYMDFSGRIFHKIVKSGIKGGGNL